MTDKVYKLKDIRAMVLEVIAEQGKDYIYDPYVDGVDGECVYFKPDNTPSCIVGHILPKLGVTREDLVEEKEYYDEVIPVDYNQETPVRGLVDELSLPFTYKAVEYLQVLQNQQDRGSSWGEAEQMANESVKEFYND